MKQKLIIFMALFFLILACKTHKEFTDASIIETKPFNKDKLYKYFYKDVEQYLKNGIIKNSFKPIIYTNVKPLETNKNIPQKIYAISNNSWKSSKKYFYNDLHGMSIVYLENNNKIVFRNFYLSYYGDDFYNYSVTKPRNKEDLIKYFDQKNVKYKILNVSKSEKADVVEVEVNNLYYKIIVDSAFCKSYLYYNKLDSINKFEKITDYAFWDGF